MKIGSGPDNDLVISDVHVSAAHATLVAQGGTWVIGDSSTNGTELRQGSRAPRKLSGIEQPLHDGDVLVFGTTELRFSSDVDGLTPPLAPKIYVPPRSYEVLTALSEPLRLDEMAPPASEREIEARLHMSNGALRDHMSTLYERLEIPADLTQTQRRMQLARSWSRATPIRP